MINRKVFFLVLILILLIPWLYQYKLLVSGEIAQGVVVNNSVYHGRRHKYHYSVIKYRVGDREFKMYGSQNVKYDLNKEIPVLYEKGNPQNSILLNFEYIYLRISSIIPGIMLIFWCSAYAAFRKKKQKNYTLAA
jgi:hypothetical protein